MRLAVLIAAIFLLAAACGSDSPQRAVVATDAPSEASTTDSPVDPAPADASNQPEETPLVLTAGVPDETRVGVTWHETIISGTTITYALVVPDGAIDRSERPFPTLLAFPPGAQDRNLVEFGLDEYWLEQARSRGWIVVSPVAPNGELFFQGSEVLIPGLLAEVAAAYPPEAALVHVAGISNGGVSSFRIAALYPDSVASVVTLPGFPNNDGDLRALDSVEFPITMWAGETDTRWVEEMLAVEARLEPLGRDVSATVVPGAGHVISADDDFLTDIWSALENAR